MMKRKFRDQDGGLKLPQVRSSRKAFFSRRGNKILLGSLLAAILGGFVFLFVISRDLPSLQQLEEYQPKLASKVYSADLKLIHEYYVEKRSFVPLEEMPPALVQAVIATEDRRFYDHWGMDLLRWPRIIFINLLSLSYEQGASTITQQLARQLYLSLEKTVTRKLKEILTAIQIERTYTKPEILEMYLNHMNFGHGSYGVQSAALKYFNKDARDLTQAESATLIGLLPAPEVYTPLRNPKLALRRRTVVLSSMRELDYITDEDYAETLKLPLEVQKKSASTAYGIAPYFTEYVRQILQDKYGYNLYTDGLSIYTTLDSRAQVHAEQAVQNHLQVMQTRVRDWYSSKADEFVKLAGSKYLDDRKFSELVADTTFIDSLVAARAPVQAALVSIDPRNGHVLAFVGGRDFAESKFNRVVQARRQPGSAFKPFVYTVAIDNGYPTTHEVLNQHVVVFLENGDRWTPQNYDLSTGGPTTFREGIRRSLNLVTVRVLQNVIRKPSLVVDYAQKMGIKSPLQAVDAIALGASDVTPLEITSAYGVFPNEGVHVEPVVILRVEDKNGNVIDRNIPRGQEALRKQTAYIMTDLLRTVADRGTGAAARSVYKFYRPAGGKTGTTNDFNDAWFIGFTPQIVTGVWVGLDDFRLSLGKGQAGSAAALPIWAPYMKAAHDTMGLPVLDFYMPEGIVRVDVCGDTKQLANDICPNILEEVFVDALAPRGHCEEHLSFTRNRKRPRKERIRF